MHKARQAKVREEAAAKQRRDLADLDVRFAAKFGKKVPSETACYCCVQHAVEGDTGYISDTAVAAIVEPYRDALIAARRKRDMQLRL
jgi:hypothetical protein